MLVPEKYGIIEDGGIETEIFRSNFSGIDGTEETSVHSIRVMPWGYPDVYSCLNTRPFFFAHRGGSAEWPEMTLRAYTQAVSEGYGGLEISLGRTSDGVIFGLHDGNINRTSGFAPGTYPAVSTMTWAEVQEHEVLPPEDHPDRDPEPYMLLSELVEAYGHSHVLLVDPKFLPTSVYEELLDYMDANGGPTRWIGKHVGDNPTWAAALASHGYERWGAYYQNDWVAGESVPEGWNDWTLLGLEFGASQAHYNDMLATGKTILTHVCFTQANVDMAFAKGASGVQVAGTEAVDPYQKFTGTSIISGDVIFTGTAVGHRTPASSGEGGFDFTGTASGDMGAKGSASGAHEFSGLAVGKRVAGGSATQAVTWAGTVETASPRFGTAEGTYTFAGGSASGVKPQSGSASGSFVFDGEADAEQDRYGFAAGGWHFASVALGKKIQKGTVSTNLRFAGFAVGKEPAKGSASSTFSVTGSATGKRVAKASTSGVFEFGGTAEGSDVALPREGVASGSWSVSGFALSDPPNTGSTGTPWVVRTSATGKKITKGTAGGAFSVSTAASGGRPAGGTGLGSFQVAGEAHSETQRDGVTSSVISWRARATGKSTPKGVATGAFTFEGIVVQYAEVPPFEVESVDMELIMISVEDE